MSLYTTINPVLYERYGFTLPFGIFVLILVAVIGLAALLEWVFMMPSYFRASNTQAWDAGGPLQDKVRAMERDVAEEKADIADMKLVLLDVKLLLEELQKGTDK